MKNLMITALSLAFTSIAMGQISCSDLKSEIYPQKVLATQNLLTKKNWKNFDVISNFRFNDCSEGVLQEIIEVNGETLWSFKTNDDACDGGNAYGSIYTADLKTPLAHIYDGDVVCESDWRDEYKSKFHRCDDAAEILVTKNLAHLGLQVSLLSSTVEVRSTHIYSKIEVSGYLNGDQNKNISVDVYFRADSCLFGAASITHLPIFFNEQDAWEKL